MYTGFTVDGVTMQMAVSKWWATGTDKPAHFNTYESCRYRTSTPHRCNPTCAPY